MSSHSRLNCKSHLTPTLTLITDQSTSKGGVNIKIHSSSCDLQVPKSCSVYIPTLFRSIFISPDEDLLFEVETSWVKLLCKFHYWQSEHFLCNQTLDNARREVEFQLDLCGGKITYQDLLEHLSIAFQGGNDKANILAEFYSCRQQYKELKEAFTDELQSLARKVISKKPNFCTNLNTTLKQQLC